MGERARDLPWVHCLTLSVLGDLEQVGQLQIGLSCRSWSHEESLVHLFGVLGEGVGLRIDTHGLYSEAVGRLGDAAGDLASVGNQKFLEHLSDWLGLNYYLDDLYASNL